MAQAYDDFEHVIVDGGSQDNTLAILGRYPHLVWISEPDDGMVDAMAKGFAMCTGEVVVYLNADDHFLPGAFAAVTPYFAAGSRVVMGRVVVRTERPGGTDEWINDPHTDLETMLRHWGPNAFCVNPVGYFIAREVQDAIPHNRENGDKHDLDFLLEVGRRFAIDKVDATLGVFNHEVGTITQIRQADPDYWNVENFDHSVSGLMFNDDHIDIECEMCHMENNYTSTHNCSECHDEDVTYPEKSPGLRVL